MKTATGATLLVSVDAVAVDTETTGLDTARDRIIQMGAVAIAKGIVDRGESIEILVDPGLPIPPASTAIHGITDAAIAGAPPFPVAWDRFAAFTARRILVGFSIGFDLAVLEQEAKRAGLDWVKPRSLCVRLLSAIANPNLPDNSLETIAAWLDVDIQDRHTALGDAIVAGHVFSALIPRLRDRGIRTLAEAERACLGLTQQLESHHRAGWAEPVSMPERPKGLASVDPFAYSHDIAQLMSSPPVVVGSAMLLSDAIALMTERRISSLFVAADPVPHGPVESYGIVTERDIMRRIAAAGAAALSEPAGATASRPLASIREAAFAYRAIGRMHRLKIRHLAVRDDAGRLAGIVSARDLLKLRAGAAVSLDDAIADAATAGELAAAWSALPSVAASLIEAEVDARNVAAIVSEELRAMTRRAAALAEIEMAAEGRGTPPCPYCVLVLGSGGRGESLLAADQDNAIVFATGEAGGHEDRWFASLGEKIAATLDTAGIPFCKGGIMARNPEWRGSLDLWRHRVSEWVVRSRPEDMLNVDIFFDMRPVHGDAGLGDALFTESYAMARQQPLFVRLLAQQLMDKGSPFTMFGGLRTENGRIDLKKYGLFPVVAAARVLAIRHGIAERATRARLEGLRAAGIGSDDDLARIIAAHGTVMSVMLAQQGRDLEEGIPVSNLIETKELSQIGLGVLKRALHDIQIVPEMVRALVS